MLPDDVWLASDPLGWLNDEGVEQTLRATFEGGQFAIGPHPILLDDFPGSIGQLDLLHHLALHYRTPLSVLELVVDDEHLTERVSARRVCPRCQPDLHRPAVTVTRGTVRRCGECGAPVVRRKSDRPDMHALRLRRYRTNLRELATAARLRGIPYRQVDAACSVDEARQAAVRAFMQLSAQPERYVL